MQGFTTDDLPDSPAVWLASIQDQLRGIFELLEGVRTWYVEAGWTDDEARAIALHGLGIVMPVNRASQPDEDEEDE